MARICYTWLEIHLSYRFQVSQPCASVSELPAALRRPQKKTHPWKFGVCILCFLSIFVAHQVYHRWTNNQQSAVKRKWVH